ncbi:uncharacterized protein [Haliotis asinina]|uniref:uncharacterized protein n=1 Tax=Haliotis asinina TaxID=109174 RepID=UPI00353268F6
MNLSALVVVAFLGRAAAQLVFYTPTPPNVGPTLGPVGPTLGPVAPTLAPVGTGGFDPNCKDKIDNCKLFGADSCKEPYDGWAKANCANTCKYCIATDSGIMRAIEGRRMNLSALVVVAFLGRAAAQLVFYTPTPPNVGPTLGPVGPTLGPVAPTLAPVGTGGFDPRPTKAPPPCKDVLKNCDQYDKKSCTDPAFKQWAEDNCRYYCRLCPPAELSMVDSMTTPIPAALCKDKLDCRLYGRDVCNNAQYVHWAKESCPAYCGICSGVPTPPPACVDKIPDCARYQKSTCTNPAFTIWVQDNCRKFCNKCGGGNAPSQPVTSGPTPKPNYPVPVMSGK